MRIKTRLQLLSIISVLCFILTSYLLIVKLQDYNEVKKNNQLISEIKNNILSASYLSDQFFLFRESRASNQWIEKNKEATTLISQIIFQLPEKADHDILLGLKNNLEDCESIFKRILDNSILEQNLLSNKTVNEELDKRLLSQLLVKTTLVLAATDALYERSEKRRDHALNHLVVTLILLLVVLYILIFVTLFYINRLILSRVKNLHEGVTNLSRGNFNFQLKCEGSDELTEITHSINKLIEKLNDMTSNISERKRLSVEQEKTKRALKEAMLLAERTAEIKSEFLANMSHEIRTPMNGIIGLSNLALNEESSPVVRDYLSKISCSSQTLLVILNDILDYSKLEAKRMKIECNPFNLNELLENLSHLFKENARVKHLEFKIEISDETPRELCGDALRLQQVLSNLIGNAIKFTEKGFVSISVSLKKKEDTTVLLLFSVTDTGIGIEKESLEKLFLPFSQAHNSISRKYGGTGLGLAISQNLLQLMGGVFNVKSQLGQGSTFEFEIPLKLESCGVKSKSTTDFKVKAGDLTKAIQEKAVGLKDAKILVAEDEPINQLVIQKYLQIIGIQSVIVGNGSDAITTLNGQAFDLILMDVHMPIMNGIEATQKIRQALQRKDLPILALSAGVTQGEHEKCLQSGMNDFITKPIDINRLIDVLLQWLPKR